MFDVVDVPHYRRASKKARAEAERIKEHRAALERLRLTHSEVKRAEDDRWCWCAQAGELLDAAGAVVRTLP